MRSANRSYGLTARVLTSSLRSGLLSGTNIVDLQFLQRDRLLCCSPAWKSAPKMISIGVGACLKQLPRKNETLVLAVHGFGTRSHVIDGRKIKLSSEEEIYEYCLNGRIANYQWITGACDDSQTSELIFELPFPLLDTIITNHWEWNSITGYVIARRQLADALDWSIKFRHMSLERRRAKELRVASIVFQDHADGTALRLWSRTLDGKMLMDRINVGLVNRTLKRVKRR